MDTAITPMGIRKNGPAAFGRRVAKIITIRMNSPVIMPVLTSMAVWNLLKTSIVALLYLLESAKILFALTHFLLLPPKRCWPRPLWTAPLLQSLGPDLHP